MTWHVGAAVAAAAVALAGSGAGPKPLEGEAPANETGLRLLVAGDPPFVFDVDSGRSTRVPGLLRLRSVSVASVAGSNAIVLAGDDVVAVRGPALRVARLGSALDAMPASDGAAAWLKSRVGASCVLRRVRLDGRATAVRGRIPCGWTIDPGGSRGVVVRRTRLIEPATTRVLYRARYGILAAAGQRLVLAGPGKAFTLVDVETKAERRLSWPSVITALDRPAVDPRGRYVALAFADPAWPGASGETVGQVLDVWLLDARTAELTQVPGMPAFVGLKVTSMAWTDDGRLVVLGEDGRRDFVAVWRPGEARLSLQAVRLPVRTGHSDSFAPLG